MDIELARTFLYIVRSGSFIAAATRLHVTQTTVTARVQTWSHNLAVHCSYAIAPGPG